MDAVCDSIPTPGEAEHVYGRVEHHPEIHDLPDPHAGTGYSHHQPNDNFEHAFGRVEHHPEIHDLPDAHAGTGYAHQQPNDNFDHAYGQAHGPVHGSLPDVESGGFDFNSFDAGNFSSHGDQHAHHGAFVPEIKIGSFI